MQECFHKVHRLQKFEKGYSGDYHTLKYIEEKKKQIEELTKRLNEMMEREAANEAMWNENKQQCEALEPCSGVKHKGFTSKNARVEFEGGRTCAICDCSIYGKSDGVYICDVHIAHKECAMKMSRNSKE